MNSPVEGHFSGRWAGSYRHRSARAEPSPIEAEIRQIGRRIEGIMRDLAPDRTEFLEDMLDRFRDGYTDVEVIQFEAAIRASGLRAVEVRTSLPPESTLIGRVRGDRVEFRKTYQGPTRSTTTRGGAVVGSEERPGHTVVYRGRLDAEGRALVGEWTIRRPGFLGWLAPSFRGTFELRREP